MTGKELAAILLQHPDKRVVFTGPNGYLNEVVKVYTGDVSLETWYSFDFERCLVLDDGKNIRKSYLNHINGEILNEPEKFTFDDTKKDGAAVTPATNR